MSDLMSTDTESSHVVRWVTDHSRAVRGYVLGCVRRIDVAEDVVQEVFRRVWEARDRYQENGTARAYLLRIADRLLCDRGRRANREVTLDETSWPEVEPVTNERPEQPMERQELNAALAAALDALSETQRRALLSRYYGDLSFAEIAEALGCPLNTALSHCHRGLGGAAFFVNCGRLRSFRTRPRTTPSFELWRVRHHPGLSRWSAD